MIVDALASEKHYRAHLRRIWEALYPLNRGIFASEAAELQGRTNPTMVAGYKDLWLVRDRPGIYVEHGAGQTYGGKTPAHPGGRGRDSVRLFINPSERIAAMNRASYPNAGSVAVGSPALDEYHRHPAKPDQVVAIAFHWNALVCPESRSAFPHYRSMISSLAKERDVIGHGHPRIAKALKRFYGSRGIRWVSLDEVYRRAEVLVVDNSSIGFEFMSLDRPVVWLNAPWYRRRVEWGYRFWEFADSGIQVDEPEDLSFAIAEALIDVGTQQRRRHEVIEQVYTACDGKAAMRAAEAIEAL